MIAYLEGELTYKSPTLVHLDIGGMAYELNISLNTYSEIENKEKARLQTQLIVRENEHKLFGFFSADEKDLFIKLLTVKGIGPNTARVILSYMTPLETRQAILHDNIAAFKKVKGVGPKSAQQIILDLKNKVAKEGLELSAPSLGGKELIREEAIAALGALGFQKNKVSTLVDKVLSSPEKPEQVEDLIKMVLKNL